MKLEFDIPAEQLVLSECVLPPHLSKAKIYGVNIKFDIFAPIYKSLDIEFFTDGNLDFTQDASNNFKTYDITIAHKIKGNIIFNDMKTTVIDYDETGSVSVRYNNYTNLVGSLGYKTQNLCIDLLGKIDNFQKLSRCGFYINNLKPPKN